MARLILGWLLLSLPVAGLIAAMIAAHGLIGLAPIALGGVAAAMIVKGSDLILG